MDKFPDDFNREFCIAKITENQKSLIKDTRSQLYEKVKENVINSKQFITYDFPQNLWQEHRIKITQEVLSRFNEVNTIKNSNGITVTQNILNPKDIPQDIQSIKIKFF